MEMGYAVKNRRSVRCLKKDDRITKSKIKNLLKISLYSPSAFSMQSSRMAVLMGERHEKFWQKVQSILLGMVKEEQRAAIKEKIEGFLGGNGTVLFFEDQEVVKAYQKDISAYANEFLGWSQHNNAMLQYTVWLTFFDNDIAASIQHYNPLIDNYVYEELGLPKNYTLIAQMPFGAANEQPQKRDYLPFDKVVTFF
ncbi:MAG: nitroreductase family protein [Christensenellaceae bacterium]